jgi:uncharacterized membrane protein
LKISIKNNKAAKKKIYLGAFFLITIIAALTRFAFIHHDFWLDELITSWVVRDDFKDIFTRSWINNLSPLYFSIEYVSKLIFGYSEIGLRLPNVIIGILTVPLIYLLTLKLSNSKTISLFISFLASIDPSLIFYSLEVRPYAFVIFFTILNFYLLILFLQKNKPLLFGFLVGFTNAIIILFHYTAAIVYFVDVAIVLYYFVFKDKPQKKDVIGILIMLLTTLILVLPITPHLKYLFSNNYIIGSFVKKESLFSVFSFHYHFYLYMLFPLLIGLFSIILLSKKERKICLPDNLYIILLLIWYFIPLILQWLFTEIDLANIYLKRYLTWIIPAAIIAPALLIKSFQSNKIKTILISFLVLRIFAFYFVDFKANNFLKNGFFKKDVYQILTQSEEDKYSWKNLVQTINNSQLEIKNIYLHNFLIESKMKDKQIHDKKLLTDYLLSMVNSLYKLKPDYLEKTSHIYSLEDISSSETHFIVITNNSELKKGTRLTPENNYDGNIFYFEKACNLKMNNKHKQ